MRQRRVVLGLATLVAVGTLSGCGSGSISADTTCADYLAQDGGARHDAAVRISSELGVSNAGNPMWGPSLDYSCGSSRDDTVGDVLNRTQD